MQIGLQDLIDWCNAWLDDYYDFYEIEEALIPELVISIKKQLETLQRIKEKSNEFENDFS